jgi:hypothetical protein
VACCAVSTNGVASAIARSAPRRTKLSFMRISESRFPTSGRELSVG